MSQDLMRIIDSICRDKNIERESYIADLEAAIVVGLRRTFELAEQVEVKLDPLAGTFSAVVDSQPVDMALLGRIAAQTVKQVVFQKTRERERTSIFEEYTERQGTIVSGTVKRVEPNIIIVDLGRTEAVLPRSEQIPGETHQVNDRIRALVLEVKDLPHQVKVVLSRSAPDFIARLFEVEVPEIAERVIEIRALAREAGYRTKVAVSSIDSKVDAVGACVGVRGSRIKNIVEELNNEKIDIVRWNESSQILIGNALKPAEVQETALCFELGKATVVVAEDQLSLAIGKRGQNVRLAARLTGWDIDIVTPAEYNQNLEALEQTLKSIEGVDDLLIDKLVAIGCVSVEHLEAIDVEPLVKVLELDPDLAEKIVFQATEEVIRREEAREAEQKARAAALAAGIEYVPPGAQPSAGEPIAEPAPAEPTAEDQSAPAPHGDTGPEVAAAESSFTARADEPPPDAAPVSAVPNFEPDADSGDPDPQP